MDQSAISTAAVETLKRMTREACHSSRARRSAASRFHSASSPASADGAVKPTSKGPLTSRKTSKAKAITARGPSTGSSAQSRLGPGTVAGPTAAGCSPSAASLLEVIASPLHPLAIV